jgi:hypothetical protein
MARRPINLGRSPISKPARTWRSRGRRWAAWPARQAAAVRRHRPAHKLTLRPRQSLRPLRSECRLSVRRMSILQPPAQPVSVCRPLARPRIPPSPRHHTRRPIRHRTRLKSLNRPNDADASGSLTKNWSLPTRPKCRVFLLGGIKYVILTQIPPSTPLIACSQQSDISLWFRSKVNQAKLLRHKSKRYFKPLNRASNR